ncbi:MAG TPA: M13 family metallopeptidase, partial [Vicinamibacterales bacterium]|nr:M13 family metallopeptidase [Vicinamibacterales bacterium]
MRRHLIAFTFVALPLAVVLAHAQPTTPVAQAFRPASESGLDLSLIDRGADPCTDFYAYACGGWTKNQPIPADRSSWGVAERLQEQNETRLRKILEDAGKSTDAETKKIGDYYASCMDEPRIDARGAAALQPMLDKIAALSSARDLPPLVAELHTMGAGVFFGFGAEADFKEASVVRAIADQGGIGLPDRDYYFRDDPKSVELRKQYGEHVDKMMTLLGTTVRLKPDTPGKAAGTAGAADTIMKIETALAKASLDVVARRDPAALYHKMTPAELQALTPSFDWTPYFKGVGAPPIDAINVTVPDFFKAFDQLIGSTPVADLQTYLRWQLVHASAVMLSKPFVDENFRFYGTTLTGAKELRPRWKRCVQYTDSDLGEALGKAFVREAFPASAKEDTLKMVRELESSMETDIKGLSWMTDATRQQALVKLHAVANKIGYPDKWRDYSALQIVRGDAIGNSQRSNRFEFQRQMNRIGKPLDKGEWEMTPPTVNAYYNPLQNNINFPAGILQPPFYKAGADAAVNYGAAGSIIGHELTHGFDDEGRQFDAQGNLKDWWTETDAKAFDDRAQCTVDQYSGFTAVDDVKVNGKLTLGENVADNGGLRIALMAYLTSTGSAGGKTLDGFTPEQRFFLSYGQSWCTNSRPERERLLAQTNPHSPPHFRVNGVVSNVPEFAKAFSCKAGQPMVRATSC